MFNQQVQEGSHSGNIIGVVMIPVVSEIEGDNLLTAQLQFVVKR